MAVDLPSKWPPSTESSVTLIPNTTVDQSQDGKPFVRVLGPARNRVSVSITVMGDQDARDLVYWLENHRAETINVTIDDGTYGGKLMGEPQRGWQGGTLSSVRFEVMG